VLFRSEAALVFALAKKYHVRAAAVFVTLDSLAELMWKPLAQLPLKKVPTALHLASKGKFIPHKGETQFDKKTTLKLEDCIARENNGYSSWWDDRITEAE
jgi:hypothetical protein